MWRSRKRTLIIVRRVLTAAKTVLAGGILEFFSARFKALVAVFNTEMASSPLLGRWDSAFMVETQGDRERTVWREGSEESSEPSKRCGSVLL